MIRPGHLTGVTVWRIAPGGTTEVQLVRIFPDKAMVCGHGMQRRWALRPMAVHPADLFETREAARAEYRRRKAVALATNPHAYLNFTTPLEAV